MRRYQLPPTKHRALRKKNINTMENNNKPLFGGIFGKSSDPDLNIPVTGGTGGAINPYLNLDPRLLQQDQDQYILPEGAGHQRGRFEMAFAQIGGSIAIGGALGAGYGGFRCRTEIKNLEGVARNTQRLNIVTKYVGSASQTCGVIALWYSIFGVATSYIRGKDDSLNTLTSGTATGIMYSLSGGRMKMLKGAGVGLSLSLMYVVGLNLLMGRDR